MNSFGGDRTGTVLSPYLPRGTVSNDFYNHYSMLKTVEDIFEVSYLDYTGQPGLLPFFGRGLLICHWANLRATANPPAPPRPHHHRLDGSVTRFGVSLPSSGMPRRMRHLEGHASLLQEHLYRYYG